MINRRETPNTVISRPALKLVMRKPAVEAVSSTPICPSARPKSPRIDGQAMPNIPSGMPRKMKTR
jgi:hypothetical protein